MARALYFYLPLPLDLVEQHVESHQEEFDDYLAELFSEDELIAFERSLDAIAAIFPQPVSSELSFDDFYAGAGEEELQRVFFESCASCICLENLPDLHDNPFQVTYLQHLLRRFEEVLIDQGGVEELRFKDSFLEELEGLKNVDSLIGSALEKPIASAPVRAVFPIDFLVQDVYKEFDRLRHHHRIYAAVELLETLPEKTQKLYKVMAQETLDADSLLRKSGLIPKDFGDCMERLKFFLRKIS